jgi:hypothetical protein
MASLMIKDLPTSQDLDRKALSNILGRGREGYEFLGSSHSQTGFQYTGNNTFSLLNGNVWYNGKWTKKYRTCYEYKNVQTRLDVFNEWWT